MAKEAHLYKYHEENCEFEPFVKVDEEMCFGKSEEADIQVSDWKCEGIHALIRRSGNGEFMIVDLGSHYGVKVNDQATDNKILKDGDLIKIGDQKFAFKTTVIGKETFLNFSDIKKEDLFKPDEDDFHLHAEKNILEVSLFWGDQLIDVKTFKEGSKVTIGNPKTSKFGIPLNDPELEGKSYELADYAKGTLTLHVPEFTNGLIWTGDEAASIDALRYYDDRYIGQEKLELKLRMGDKAYLEIGELSLNFKFTRPADKVPVRLFKMPDKDIFRLMASVLALFIFMGIIVKSSEPELAEKKLKDIPKHLKKVVYKSGITQAQKQRKAAIGRLAKNDGGRAKSEEGKSKAKKAPKKQEVKKAVAKKKPIRKKKTAKKVAKKQPKKSKKSLVSNKKTKEKTVAKAPEVLDLDTAFKTPEKSAASASTTSIVSKVKVDGNTVSALTDGGYARGKSGLGAGGGGKSVGVGSLSGYSQGGGIGSEDYGLAPSKGVEIRIPDKEEIVVQDGLDPDVIAARIRKYLPQIQHCYEQQLVQKPNLKGKVTAAFTIIGNGSIGAHSIPTSSLNDKATEKCILSKIKNWKFPKPRGGGKVSVRYPFLLMSNQGK